MVYDDWKEPNKERIHKKYFRRVTLIPCPCIDELPMQEQWDSSFIKGTAASIITALEKW